MVFKTKEIKTSTLGEELKRARESAKIALWQASRKTRIPIKHLKHLEEGNYQELPADVYIVAYLKKYAQLLNLDIREILKQLKTERGIRTDLSKPKKISRPPLWITPKRLGLVLAIISIALVFGYFWHQLSYVIYAPNIEISQPISDLTIQERSIEISGQTKPGVYLTVNGKEVYVDNRGYFRSEVGLESGLNILKIEARDRFGKTNTVIRKIYVK